MKTDSILIFLIKVAGILLSLSVGIVLARWLGPSEFGIYSYIMAMAGILIVPAQFGFPTLATREIARADGDPEKVRAITRWMALWGGALALGTFLIAVVGVLLWMPNMTALSVSLVILGLLAVPLQALTHLSAGMMRGVKRSVGGQVPGQVLRPGLFLLLLLAFYLLSNVQNSARTALVLNILAAASTTLVAVWMVRRALHAHMSGATGLARAEASQRRAWISSIVPLAMVGGLNTINKQADILVLGLFRPHSDVGIYQVAVRGALLVSFVLLSVSLVLGPHLAQYYKQGRREELQALLTKASRAIFALSIVPVLIFVFFGAPIITFVFGADYASGAISLAILCIGMLATCATGPLIALLNMTGHENGTLRGVALGAASNVCLNFVLIPWMGMAGAATATAATYLIWNVYLWWYCRSKLGFDTSALGLTLREQKGLSH